MVFVDFFFLYEFVVVQTVITQTILPYSEDASKVMIELLGTYTTENASQAREDAHRCIIASLADPTTYIMDHLLTLKV